MFKTYALLASAMCYYLGCHFIICILILPLERTKDDLSNRISLKYSDMPVMKVRSHRSLKVLKVLIGIICLWALTLPWTFNYLSAIAPSPSAGVERLIGPVFRKVNVKNDRIVVGIVSCGEKSLNDAEVLLKSIILSSTYYGISTMDFILFADNENLNELELKIRKLQGKGLKFRYEIHPVAFPARDHNDWKTLYKPCSTQRLFMHSALPHVDEILYLDVDTIVLGDLREIWSRFRRMSTEQVMGIAAEHEIPSVGWYNKFAKHPFYPPLGLNTGVMLMNLTRLRMSSDLNWEEAVLESYKKFKDKLVWGDQDVINIVFHQRPDAVYLLPCSFNYRAEHCIYGQNCKEITRSEGKGIQILHGNKGAFHNSTISPLFKKLYEYFKEFDMDNNDYIQDIVHPFKRQFDSVNTESNKEATDCDNIGNFIFNFYSTQK